MFAPVTAGAQDLEIGGHGLSSLGYRNYVVYLQTHFIGHILSADLAGVVIPLHDFLTELWSQKLSLLLTVVFFKCGFVVDSSKHCIPGSEVGVVARICADLISYFVSRPLVVALLVPGLHADNCEAVGVIVVYERFKLFFPSPL